MNLTTTPPLLPTEWFYALRTNSEDYKQATNVRLPGLTGLWNLEAISDLTFCEPENESRLSFGRGGIIQSGSLVLRPYKRGGLIRHINKSTYYGISRFQQEFYVHKAIWRAGLPTVEPIGWAYKTNMLGSQGVFITRFTKGSPWPHNWNQSLNFLHQLKTLLTALCSWGLYAPDLNATNLLLSPDKDLLALDWDQATWSKRTDLMERYQERLVRSMKKLGAEASTISKIQRYIENDG